MKFGRLANVDGVDFALPPDKNESSALLGTLRERIARPEPRVMVGTSGWSSKTYVGSLYPAGMKSGEYLRAYGRAFPTNELNSTYYGVDPERIRRWAAAVPESFRFCPKLPSTVSHERELRDVGGDMESFLAALAGFGAKLGRAFTVLPPGFGPTRMADLALFVETYAARLDLAIELRHEGWFSDAGAARAAFGLFEAHGVAAVLTDVAGRRDVLHMRLTTPDAFVRFVGNGLHASDFTRLDEWSERLAVWLEAGLETAYLFLHQPDDVNTIDLAEHVIPKLAARTGLGLEPPSAADPSGQLELF
jgi:uncharacterized protein YecE (DUF72 family)